MEIYQLIAPSIAIYYIYRIVVNIKTGRKFVFSTILWLILWLLITVLSINPNGISVAIAKFLGIKDNTNAIIFIILAFLIVLSFYLSSRTEKLERKMTELVRQLALKEGELAQLKKKEKSNLKVPQD